MRCWRRIARAAGESLCRRVSESTAGTRDTCLVAALGTGSSHSDVGSNGQRVVDGAQRNLLGPLSNGEELARNRPCFALIPNPHGQDALPQEARRYLHAPWDDISTGERNDKRRGKRIRTVLDLSVEQQRDGFRIRKCDPSEIRLREREIDAPHKKSNERAAKAATRPQALRSASRTSRVAGRGESGNLVIECRSECVAPRRKL